MTTRTPTPHARALWQEVVDARRAEYTARRADSREHRRADETQEWLGDLRETLESIAATVHGEQFEPNADPRAVLVDLLAIASAWVAAMDGQGAVE